MLKEGCTQTAKPTHKAEKKQPHAGEERRTRQRGAAKGRAPNLHLELGGTKSTQGLSEWSRVRPN